MAVHQKTQHEADLAGISQWETLPSDLEPQTYRMDFQTAMRPQEFPVKECMKWAATRTVMIVHFLHRDIWDTVIILEEVNLPHPWYTRCDVLVPCKDLNGRHLTTAHCEKGSE